MRPFRSKKWIDLAIFGTKDVEKIEKMFGLLTVLLPSIFGINFGLKMFSEYWSSDRWFGKFEKKSFDMDCNL